MTEPVVSFVCSTAPSSPRSRLTQSWRTYYSRFKDTKIRKNTGTGGFVFFFSSSLAFPTPTTSTWCIGSGRDRPRRLAPSSRCCYSSSPSGSSRLRTSPCRPSPSPGGGSPPPPRCWPSSTPPTTFAPRPSWSTPSSTTYLWTTWTSCKSTTRGRTRRGQTSSPTVSTRSY